MKGRKRSLCKTPVCLESSKQQTETVASDNAEENVDSATEKTLEINEKTSKCDVALLSANNTSSSELEVQTDIAHIVEDYDSVKGMENCTALTILADINNASDSKGNIVDNISVPIEYCTSEGKTKFKMESEHPAKLLGGKEKFAFNEKFDLITKMDNCDHNGEKDKFIHKEKCKGDMFNDNFVLQSMEESDKIEKNLAICIPKDEKQEKQGIVFINNLGEEIVDRDKEENSLSEMDKFEFKSIRDEAAHLPFKKRRICTPACAEDALQRDNEVSFPPTPMISIAEVALTTPYLLSLYSGFPNTFQQFPANNAAEHDRIAFVVPSKRQSKDYYQYMEK